MENKNSFAEIQKLDDSFQSQMDDYMIDNNKENLKFDELADPNKK